MSTLYGNGIAWNYISLNRNFNYPKGAILHEVTWRQKTDSVWFGANIPKEIIKVESVTFTDSKIPTYVQYEGHPLKNVSTISEEQSRERITKIVSQRFAAAP